MSFNITILETKDTSALVRAECTTSGKSIEQWIELPSYFMGDPRDYFVLQLYASISDTMVPTLQKALADPVLDIFVNKPRTYTFTDINNLINVTDISFKNDLKAVLLELLDELGFTGRP